MKTVQCTICPECGSESLISVDSNIPLSAFATPNSGTFVEIWDMKDSFLHISTGGNSKIKQRVSKTISVYCKS